VLTTIFPTKDEIDLWNWLLHEQNLPIRCRWFFGRPAFCHILSTIPSDLSNWGFSNYRHAIFACPIIDGIFRIRGHETIQKSHFQTETPPRNFNIPGIDVKLLDRKRTRERSGTVSEWNRFLLLPW